MELGGSSRKDSKGPSDLLREYNDFFASISHKVNPEKLRCRLAQADIVTLTIPEADKSFLKSFPKLAFQVVLVRPVKVEARGALITYRVEFGELLVHVRMLNVQGKGPITNRKLVYSSSTGLCSVYFAQSVKGGEFACKRFYFTQATQVLKAKQDGVDWAVPSRYSEVESALVEYSIAKVCDALGAGVKVGSIDHGFELVCYSDCLEFFMEKCLHINSTPLSRKGRLIIEESLKAGLYSMHMFRLIHKDVKLSNVLFSEKTERAVFADFGISSCVPESPGQKSHTYKEGTRAYMSPEMESLQREKVGQVDLYYNDVWGLRRTLLLLEQSESDSTNSPKRTENSKPSPSQVEMDIKILWDAESGRTSEEVLGQPQLSHFYSYFKSLNPNVPETDYDLEFLVRSFGLSKLLLPYLVIQYPANKKAQLLSQRLQKHSQDRYPLIGLHCMGDLQIKRRHLQLCFKRLSRKRNPEDLALACELAISLVDRFHRQALLDTAEELLDRISRLIDEKYQGAYQTLVATNQLMRGTADNSIFNSLSNIHPSNLSYLYNGFKPCLQRKQYGLAYSILKCMFSHPDSHKKPNADFMLELLQQQLKLETNRLSISKYKDLIGMYHLVAMHCHRYDLIANFPLEDLPKYSTQLLATCCRLKGHAFIELGAISEARTYYSKACTLHRQSAGEWSFFALESETTLIVIQLAANENKFEAIPRLLSIKSYLVNFEGEERDSLIVNICTILARILFESGKVHQSLFYAREAAHIQKGTCLDIKFFAFLIQLIGWEPALPFIVEMAECAEHYIRKLEANACFEWFVKLSCLYEFIGVPSKANKYELEAFNMLRIKSLSRLEKLSLCLLLLDNKDCTSHQIPLRDLRFLLFANEVLEEHAEQFEPVNLLILCCHFAKIKVLDRSKEHIFKRWFQLLTQRGQLQACLDSAKQMLGLSLVNSKCYAEAIYIFESCRQKTTDICYQLGASYLYSARTDHNRKFVQYFKEFLDRCSSTPFDANSSQRKLNVIVSHKMLFVYAKEEELKQYHKQRFLWCCDQSKRRLVEEVSVLKFLLTSSPYAPFQKEVLAAKKRACMLIHRREVQLLPVPRISLIKEYVYAAQQHEHYQEVAYYRREILDNLRQLRDEDVMAIVKNDLILRKLRLFYRSAGILADCFPGKMGDLQAYLRQRRESVKEYMLFGEYSPEHSLMTRALKWLNQGNVPTWRIVPTKQKLVILVLLKRLRAQSRRVKSENGKSQVIVNSPTALLTNF